jgi:hypothetical protein
MFKFVCNLVKNLATHFVAKSRTNGVRLGTTWELFPYSFGVDWYSPYNDYHLKSACNCYYCRRKWLLSQGDYTFYESGL